MKLRIEDLHVDSFATVEAGADARGTVQAHEVTPLRSCQPRYTCPECASPVFEPAERED